MSHADISKSLKDTEEVESVREGQSMQSMDEKPTGSSMNQQSGYEASGQEQQDAQANETSQETQETQLNEENQKQQGWRETAKLEETQSGQTSGYTGNSEQIPFSYPQPPAPYQSGPTMPPQQGTNWSYPPSPAHYQAGAPGQAPFNPATTRPFQARPTGPFSQTTQPTNTFETTYPGPIQHTAQPGLPHGSMYPQAGTISQPPGKPKRSGMRTGAILALTLLLAAVFASGLVSGWTLRSSNTPSSNNNGLQPGNTSTVTVPQLTDNNADAVREAVVNKVQPGVVQIDVTSNGQRALGSGVIIDGRGYIVTNNHVVSGASTIQVTLADGTVLPGKLAGSDKADDLAIVKITPPASGLTVVEIGDSSQLKVGQEVLALGSPLGNSETVTRGIVSALNRNVSEGQNAATLPDAIQTDAPINPGNSGGALVDMQGKLIGIPTLNAVDTEYNTPANGLGFAIPSNRVKFIAEQVINDGSVTHTGRAFMGVSISSVTQAVADQNNLGVNSGAVISSLTAGGPAANAGLRQNDVITQIDTTAIHSTTDVSSALLQHKPGDTVTIKYYRGTQQLSTNLVLGELPVS